ncbi:MAG: S9 family peptidase [Acidimicrobiales bacterium]
MAGMTPRDIGGLVGVDEVRLAPDGAQVAFTVWTADLDANEYRRAIWVGPTDGTAPPYPFTAGEPADTSPRWSPDGRYLAFVSHKKKDGKAAGSAIRVAPVGGGGEVRTVVAWDEVIDALEWSPDGSTLAFGARVPDADRTEKQAKDQPPRRLTHLFQRIDSVGWLHDRHRHLHTVPADGSVKPTTITSGAPDTQGLWWLPDGRRLAFVHARHDSWDIDRRDDIWTVEADASGAQPEPHRVTATDSTWSWPVVAPDGERMAAIWYASPDEVHHGHLVVVDIATGDRVLVTEKLDRPCHNFMVPQGPVWVGDNVVFLIEDHGNQHVYRVPGDASAPPEPVVNGDRWVHSFDAVDDLLAFAVSSPTSQPEVVIVGPDGRERQITRLGGAFASRVETSTPVRFTATSPDGTEVEAWYVPPVGAEDGGRYPTLVNVHGGPFTQYGNKFFDEFQIEVGAGYGVVYCNPRGSSGYGEAWGQAVAWPSHPTHPGSGWGRVDADDVLAVVDEAGQRFPTVDPDRLGVMGGSYGGYMTTWLLGHTDRFKAGCSERAANDLLGLERASDIATAFFCYSGRRAFENPEVLIDHSPITYAPNIHTPLLIIHSEGDLRCPIDQAASLFSTLRVLGREVQWLLFPEESHELSRSGAPQHRMQRAEAILEWFDRWLKP